MEIQAVAGRITELEHAFQRLSGRVPGLKVEVVGHMSNNRSLVHPIAGFQVKLQHEGENAGVLLYVSASYAELTRWPTDGGAMRERFNVRLSEGFVWGESSFDEADDLASELLAYMQFNLDTVSL
ncbi:MAG: hypothetical protein WEE89_11075 [Gemmatimonadota bacterium]